MIIQEFVYVGIGGRNISYYEEKGYLIPKKIDKKGRTNFTKGIKIKVRVCDLMKTSKNKILCKCEYCGLERKVSYESLLNRKNSSYIKDGETPCISCANKKNFKGENSPKYIHGNNRYCEYKYNAAKRGYKFELTIEEFEKFTNEKCHYCGGYSSDYINNSRGNGIDRKNNNIGYIKENCVSCCYRCNFFKNKIGYKEFIEHINKIYLNRIKKCLKEIT